MHVRFALTFGRGHHRHAMLERARGAGLQRKIEWPKLLLLTDDRTPLLLSDQAILVGRLFTAGGEEAKTLPQALQSPSAAEPGSSKLWGNFILVRCSNGGASLYREPSGSVAAYRLTTSDEGIFFSDAATALALGLLEDLSTDPRFALHWLQFPFLRSAATGLSFVREVIPGTSIGRSGSGGWTETSAWSPAAFVRQDQAILKPRLAEAQLRETALLAVRRQIGSDRPALQLSGGLDSSIVACCLGTAGRRFDCINFATRSLDGDERGFARDVATRFELSLHELAEAKTTELAVPTLPTFRPSTNPLLLPFEQAIARKAEELGANVLVDGAGGDNLFCHLTSAAPVLDAFLWGGLRQGLQTIGEIAIRADAGWWDVVRAAVRRASRKTGWKDDRSFLLGHALLARPDPHPWLEGLDGAPPGKREHVEALVHIQHFLDRRASAIPVAHPLMAQPLLELCLRIPSWLWMAGGRDRAVARSAFEGLLPISVLKRRSKGSLQGFFTRSFVRLRPQILDVLMSGRLADERIIDRSLVEHALRSDEAELDQIQLRISEMLALELWLQSWANPQFSHSSRA